MNLNDRQLRVAHIWEGEIISDVLITEPAPVVMGSSGDATIVVPASKHLPERFELFRPTETGYVLTLARGMGGQLQVGNQKKDIASLAQGGADGFRGEIVQAGDLGLIDLDATGRHQIYFVFEKPTGELPKSPIVNDLDQLLPALAFAVVFVGFFLIYAIGIYKYDGPGFLWPGPRHLVATYGVDRPPPIVEEEAPAKAGEEDGEENATPASTVGASGKAGGEGDKPRKMAEDPDQGEPDQTIPEEIQVGLLDQRSRQTFDKVRNRGGFDKKLGKALARLSGPSNDGSLAGFGGGGGTGYGDMEGGSGSNTRGGKGPGGGGSAHADVQTQGELNTGGKRVARGTPGGKGVKEVQVAVSTGTASGSLGGLTDKQIRDVVRTRLRAIQACFSREYQRNKGLGGNITVSWTIDSSGLVSRARVSKTTMGNSTVEDCVVRQVNSMKFPSPKGGNRANVKFPFIFSGG